jgi:vacuolar protein sorting-associated protein 13A/C
MGLKSAASGVVSGAAGLVKDPMEGANREGLYGFSTGVLKGVAGLFAKPVSGTLDLISNTTEGFKNTQKTTMELEADKRLRNPRAVYSRECIIREYNEEHATWLHWINLTNRS